MKTTKQRYPGIVSHVVCKNKKAEDEFHKAILSIKDLYIDWEQSELSWEKGDKKKLFERDNL